METSCCGAYEWAAQGGHFLILRPTREPGHYEETARGLHRQAREVWTRLVASHTLQHHNERRGRSRGPRDERAA